MSKKSWFERLIDWLLGRKATDVVEPVKPTPEAAYSRKGWDEARFVTCPEAVRTWPVVDRLTVQLRGGQFSYGLEHPELWPVVKGKKPTIGSLFCFLVRDGQMWAGPCDYLRPVGAVKEKKDVCVPDGDDRLYVPRSGETVGIGLAGFCRRGEKMAPKQVAEVAWVVWP